MYIDLICIQRTKQIVNFILIFVTLCVWFLKGSHEPVFSKCCYRNNWPERYHWCSVSIYFSFRFALALSLSLLSSPSISCSLLHFGFVSHFFVSRFNLGIFYESSLGCREQFNVVKFLFVGPDIRKLAGGRTIHSSFVYKSRLPLAWIAVKLATHWICASCALIENSTRSWNSLNLIRFRAAKYWMSARRVMRMLHSHLKRGQKNWRFDFCLDWLHGQWCCRTKKKSNIQNRSSFGR